MVAMKVHSMAIPKEKHLEHWMVRQLVMKMD